MPSHLFHLLIAQVHCFLWNQNLLWPELYLATPSLQACFNIRNPNLCNNFYVTTFDKKNPLHTYFNVQQQAALMFGWLIGTNTTANFCYVQKQQHSLNFHQSKSNMHFILGQLHLQLSSKWRLLLKKPVKLKALITYLSVGMINIQHSMHNFFLEQMFFRQVTLLNKPTYRRNRHIH